MFCTGDIVTVDYCMEIYRQFLNRETFDFFIVAIWEIREPLHKIHQELKFFEKKSQNNYLDCSIICYLKTRNLEKVLMTQRKCLKKQFTKFIITDALYSSGIFTNIEGVFFRNKTLINFFFFWKNIFSERIFFCERNIFFWKNIFWRNIFFFFWNN